MRAGPALIIVMVVIMMMPPPISPIRTIRTPGLLIVRAVPARAVIRGAIPVSTIVGIAMVRRAAYNSADQKKNQESVLEEGCHTAFLSLSIGCLIAQTPCQRRGRTSWGSPRKREKRGYAETGAHSLSRPARWEAGKRVARATDVRSYETEPVCDHSALGIYRNYKQEYDEPVTHTRLFAGF